MTQKYPISEQQIKSHSGCNIAIIGGGAAGFFGAITCAQTYPNSRVVIFEKTRQVLAKVKISGGGRCNLTNACFDPHRLSSHYPRGGKALIGPFTRFQPKDTIRWFEQRGVMLKAEEDGRMFPITNNSETIIECLCGEAKKSGITIRLECGVEKITKLGNGFQLTFSTGEQFLCDKILITTGGNTKTYPLLETLGHQIVPPVPSLFTFNIPQSPLEGLEGISVPKTRIKIGQTNLEQTGPLLITHWGLSGPAVLKLSAWGAKILYQKSYEATLEVNWMPDLTKDEIAKHLQTLKHTHANRSASTDVQWDLPKHLWRRLVHLAKIDGELRWAELSKKQFHELCEKIHKSTYQIQGKTTYKQEFVTCGGINLHEVNFKTMESKICPGLYFAGEILDIDGVTGGFNFQNAWTTSWIAGQSIGKEIAL